MRNAESHFSVNPVDIDVPRSRFERPFNHQFTSNLGTLVPFFCSEILPGDTVKIKTNRVIRMTTLIDPIFGTLYSDVYYFFVPMRLTWEHTKEFFGENTSGPWAPSTSYTIPQIKFPTEGGIVIQPHNVLDYLGVPSSRSMGSRKISALPVRAYNIVYRDWFMSEAVETPPNIYLGDSDQEFDPDDPITGGSCYTANRLFDVFSSALPAPQRGSSVTIPLGGNITVSGSGSSLDITTASSTHYTPNSLRLGNGSTNWLVKYADDQSSYPDFLYVEGAASTHPTGDVLKGNNLIVKLPTMTANMENATPISVNDLRLAFQIQRWYEKAALYGGRYIETIKANFGITSPDARLQRSEYLGGNRIPIAIHQVENTNGAGGSDATPLGHLGAYSATADSEDSFIHSFTEHGFLVGVTCIRAKRSYSDGLEKMWSRKTMFDLYWPVLSSIGNTPVMTQELYMTSSNDSDVWGYQEAWYDYRYFGDRCSGYMRPGISNSLASWNLADHYSSQPTLSETWLGEDATLLDRCLSVAHTYAPQFIQDFYLEQEWTRCMPMYSIPGLIDHH